MACLVFAPGRRPDLAAFQDAARKSGAFSISHAGSADADWLELLRNGLTFDVHGLSSGPSIALPSMPHRFDLPQAMADPPAEAVVIALGPHLAGSERLMPVIRTVAGLAMALSALPGVQAIGWLPSKSLCSPRWFEKAVSAWLDGGPFPSLALSAFSTLPEGGLRSHGLSFVGGQDFDLPAGEAGTDAENGRLAMRIADWLVAHGPVTTARQVDLPGASAIRLEPRANGLLSISRA